MQSDLDNFYDADYFKKSDESAAPSARAMWPLILSLVGPVRSVLDVGCGSGSWLAVLRAADSAVDILGVDHPGVAEPDIVIPRDKYVGADLNQPLDLRRKFDLALSFEVAEHLPPESASTFVDNLARHADTIVFSAAIPRQAKGSSQYHLNEQWPSYWIALFAERGFRCRDCLRPLIWKNQSIALRYRQNSLIFYRGPMIAPHAKEDWGGGDFVHPDLFVYYRRRISFTPRNLLRFLRGSLEGRG